MIGKDKKVLIAHQPYFLPSLEYFARIKESSQFLLLDNVQYNRRDWQSKTMLSDGLLSIPLRNKNNRKLIRNLFTAIDSRFVGKVTRRLGRLYGESNPYVEVFIKSLLDCYDHQDYYCFLMETLITLLQEALHPEDRKEKCVVQSQLPYYFSDDPSRRLAQAASVLNCDVYAFGRGSPEYLRFEEFWDRGIDLASIEWKPPAIKFPKGNIYISSFDFLCKGYNLKECLGEIVLHSV